MALRNIKRWMVTSYLRLFPKLYPHMDIEKDFARGNRAFLSELLFRLLKLDNGVSIKALDRLLTQKPTLKKKVLQLALLEDKTDQYPDFAQASTVPAAEKSAPPRLLAQDLMQMVLAKHYQTAAKVMAENEVMRKQAFEILLGNKKSCQEAIAWVGKNPQALLGRIVGCGVVEQTSELRVWGWFLPNAAYDTIKVYSKDEFLGTARLGLPSAKLQQAYPALNAHDAGWFFELPHWDPAKCQTIWIKAFSDGQLIHEIAREIDTLPITQEAGPALTLHISESSIPGLTETGAARIRQFNNICAAMTPWVDIANPVVQQNLLKSKKEVFEGKTQIEDIFMDIICKDNLCFLKNAQIEFIDKKQLWLMMTELLQREDYYIHFEHDTPVIVDCGVNIGMSIYYAKARYPKAEIVGFEPWKTAYDIAQRNITRNGWTDVTLYPYALAGENGSLTLHVPTSNSLGATITNRWEGQDLKQIPTTDDLNIACRKLSDFLVKPLDFLKMDIEGAETQVLRDIAPKLSQIKYLFCEYHYGPSIHDNSFAELVSLLEKAGFVYEVRKSYSYARASDTKPMTHVGKIVSMELFGKNIKWMPPIAAEDSKDNKPYTEVR